jgi:hypothetical protein
MAFNQEDFDRELAGLDEAGLSERLASLSPEEVAYLGFKECKKCGCKGFVQYKPGGPLCNSVTCCRTDSNGDLSCGHSFTEHK